GRRQRAGMAREGRLTEGETGETDATAQDGSARRKGERLRRTDEHLERAGSARRVERPFGLSQRIDAGHEVRHVETPAGQQVEGLAEGAAPRSDQRDLVDDEGGQVHARLAVVRALEDD